MTDLKDLTKDETQKAAVDLIKMFGTTTTLDVKTELRGRGFKADQSEVSKFMAELAKELKWKTQKDGNHVVYTNSDAKAWWQDGPLKSFDGS